jgi:hypothetical protein
MPQSNRLIAFLCALCVLAVSAELRIHRQDAKSAKNFAKQNSFQERMSSEPSLTVGLPTGIGICVGSPTVREGSLTLATK